MSLPVDPEKRLYVYDPIGNRRSATENTDLTAYTANNLNQYTALSGAKSATPVHDDDGNVTDYKNMKYSWNAENQMISAEPKNPSEGDRKTEYLYDYMGWRARKQIFGCLENYDARYNPVRLRLEEMKPIPAEKADFHEPDTGKTGAETVRDIISGIGRIGRNVKGFIGSVRKRLSEYEEEKELNRLIGKVSDAVVKSGGVKCEISPDLERYGIKTDGAVLMFRAEKSLDLINFHMSSAIPLKAYFLLHAYDRENRLVGTFSSGLSYEVKNYMGQFTFTPDSDFDQNRITKLVLSVKPD